MQNWKELFRPHILERGRNYYEEGAVVSLDRTDTGYHAEVEGTEDYEVSIEIQDDEITDMYCSCPYADSGNYCKHMAAVLYEIEGGPGDPFEELAEWKNERLQAVQDLIERIPEEELKKLMASLICQDEDLYNRLMTQYAPVGPATLTRLKHQIDEIGWKYSDRSGFIDYRNAYEYVGALGAVLYKNVPQLLKRNCPEEAFELTNYVFHEIGNREMDDSDGGYTYIGGVCYDNWKKILMAADEEQEKQMIRWFREHRRNYVSEYMEDYLENFLITEFHDEGLLREQIREVDEKIEKLEQNEAKDSWNYQYLYPSCVLQRVSLMERLECPKEEIRRYRNRYRQFHEIREAEVKDYLLSKEYDRAEAVLKESKELDKGSPRLVSKYSAKLIEIYDMTGQKEKYKSELIWHIFECGEYGLDNPLKLKAVCSTEEWQELRGKMLVSEKLRTIRCELLDHEEMYDRLMQEIRTSGSINALDRYEKVLKKQFPEEVRDMYVRYVQRAAEGAAQRKAYRDLMGYLKKIRRYPDGRNIAEKTAAVWKDTYKRRPAMMDELRKAGF